MKEATVQLKDGKMFYKTEGQGEPLVLIHSIGLSSELWDGVSKALSEKFTVYNIDMIGHGNSDKPDMRYEIHHHAESIIEFMDKVGIKKANIIGSSIGALISIEMSSAFPDRVIKQVLAATFISPSLPSLASSIS